MNDKRFFALATTPVLLVLILVIHISIPDVSATTYPQYTNYTAINAITQQHEAQLQAQQQAKDAQQLHAKNQINHFLKITLIANGTLAKYNIIAVEYSEACQKMLEHHMNSTCPTIDKIWKYDTTNRNISGKLLLSNGTFSRTNPQVRNHYMWYNTMTVCIACSLNNIAGLDMIKTIFIEPSSFTYVNKTAELKNSNTWYSYSNRYVSPNCVTATIAYTDDMLSDTITYMLSNCTKTFMHVTQTHTIKSTPLDYTNSIYYKEKAWQDSVVKATKSQDCIHKICDTAKDPFAKKAWN